MRSHCKGCVVVMRDNGARGLDVGENLETCGGQCPGPGSHVEMCNDPHQCLIINWLKTVNLVTFSEFYLSSHSRFPEDQCRACNVITPCQLLISLGVDGVMYNSRLLRKVCIF